MFGVDFENQLRSIYEFCRLDYASLEGMIRLKAKNLRESEADALAKHWAGSGFGLDVVPGREYWMPIGDVARFVDFSVNRRQRDALSDTHRKELEKLCGPILDHFGYLTPVESSDASSSFVRTSPSTLP